MGNEAPRKLEPVETPWLTTDEAAHYGKMTRGALLKAIERGRIVPDAPARKGWTRVHRFKRETIDLYLMGGQHGEK